MAKQTYYKKLIEFSPAHHGLADIEDLINTLNLTKSYLVFEDVKLPTYLFAFEAADNQRPSSPSRFNAVRRLLVSISISFLTGAHRPKSLPGIVSNLCNLVRWADNNNLPDLMSNATSYKNAVDSRVSHLRKELLNGKLGEHTVATETTHCMMGGSWIFDLPMSYFQEGVKRIKRSRKNLDSITEPPSYHDIKESYALNIKLFDQLTDFLINKRSFPYQITLPREKVWVLPNKSWGATECMLANLPEWGKSKFWNYKTGQIYSLEEATQWAFTSSERPIDRCIGKLEKESLKLKEANSDFSCWQRVTLAQWAHDAYLTVFTANTSANEESIISFTWDDSLLLKDCIYKKTPKLRTIKYRAHGKEVSFEIRAKTLSSFEKFLELRKFLLHGREHKYLFLSLYRNNEVRRLPVNALRRHYRRIQAQLYPDFVGIDYREWRAINGSTAFDAVGVETASTILQNSPRSVIRSYSKGTIENWEKDFSEYFNAFSKEFRKFKKKAIPIGHCNAENDPQSLIPTVSLQPDCLHFEGCLNCDKFSLHADAEDIRKIISMQYVILASEPAAKSKESFDYAFSGLLRKVDWILTEISSIDEARNKLVQDIRHDVFQHEAITEYWQFKLDMLVQMEVIQ